MDAIKNFLAGKKPGWYVSLASCVLALVTVIVYGVRGGNSYSPVSGAVIAVLVVGIVTNALVLVKDFGVGAFIPFILYAVSLGILLNTEMLFMSNVIVGIDGNSFDGAWFVFIVTELLTICAALAACIMNLSKPAKN